MRRLTSLLLAAALAGCGGADPCVGGEDLTYWSPNPHGGATAGLSCDGTLATLSVHPGQRVGFARDISAARAAMLNLIAYPAGCDRASVTISAADRSQTDTRQVVLRAFVEAGQTEASAVVTGDCPAMTFRLLSYLE